MAVSAEYAAATAVQYRETASGTVAFRAAAPGNALPAQPTGPGFQVVPTGTSYAPRMTAGPLVVAQPLPSGTGTPCSGCLHNPANNGAGQSNASQSVGGPGGGYITPPAASWSNALADPAAAAQGALGQSSTWQRLVEWMKQGNNGALVAAGAVLLLLALTQRD